MKKIIYTLLVLLIISMSTYAQKETSWWYFGYNAGLNFNIVNAATADDGSIITNLPKAISGPIRTGEGCFSVSTYDGKLLFSSDGRAIYDKNGAVMTNGTGLLGGTSATQSGIVFPKPGSLTEYYVITVPQDYTTNPNGIRYSVVDISKQGGLGEVIQSSKNTIIRPGTVYENIAAVPNTNGKDYWLIHRAEGEICVWEVTNSGISSTPHQVFPNADLPADERGYYGETMLSMDFKKIAMSTYNMRQVFTADFDPTTGLVSDIMMHPLDETQPYGVEFSPNGKYLYVASAYLNDGRFYVADWDDLRSGSADPFNFLTSKISNVKKALDGRLYGIYTGRKIEAGNVEYLQTRNLVVVLNPNEGGTNIKFFSNYLTNVAYIGLPTFASGFIRIIPKENPFACTAYDRTYTIEVDLSGGNAPARLEWDFGDGTPIENQVVNPAQSAQKKLHKYNNAGVYTVTVTPYKADGTALDAVIMAANIIDCTLKTNRMTRSELFNSKELEK